MFATGIIYEIPVHTRPPSNKEFCTLLVVIFCHMAAAAVFKDLQNPPKTHTGQFHLTLTTETDFFKI